MRLAAVGAATGNKQIGKYRLMTDDPQNSGHRGAHTLAENSASGAADGGPALDIDADRAAKIGATRATAEAAVADLAQRLTGGDEAEQSELLLADPGEEFSLFAGPVRHVANIRDADKRGRGRPRGSQNRASKDLANYLLSMGYRDPALNLADMANSTPADLAAELGCDPLDAISLILKANAELLPYFHAKRPQQVEVNGKVLGIMVIGEMATDRGGEEQVIDITRADAPT
jgi:hypothetical protein